jgi:hypothetical protein
MPLSFRSRSHGNVAFGFFNIESDMLLLEQYFLFAADFCASISKMAQNAGNQVYEETWEVYEIAEKANIGDLRAAIQGAHSEGFIGEVYRRFPFPKDPAEFKQKPHGFSNSALMQALIKPYAQVATIQCKIDEHKHVIIGPYEFRTSSFHELIRYVWQGGYPRWENGVRPHYVIRMRDRILKQQNGIFQGLLLRP